MAEVKQEITEKLARVKAQRPTFSHEIKGLFKVQSVMTDRYARRAGYEGQRQGDGFGAAWICSADCILA